MTNEERLARLREMHYTDREARFLLAGSAAFRSVCDAAIHCLCWRTFGWQ